MRQLSDLGTQWAAIMDKSYSKSSCEEYMTSVTREKVITVCGVLYCLAGMTREEM